MLSNASIISWIALKPPLVPKAAFSFMLMLTINSLPILELLLSVTSGIRQRCRRCAGEANTLMQAKPHRNSASRKSWAEQNFITSTSISIINSSTSRVDGFLSFTRVTFFRDCIHQVKDSTRFCLSQNYQKTYKQEVSILREKCPAKLLIPHHCPNLRPSKNWESSNWMARIAPMIKVKIQAKLKTLYTADCMYQMSGLGFMFGRFLSG